MNTAIKVFFVASVAVAIVCMTPVLTVTPAEAGPKFAGGKILNGDGQPAGSRR